MTQILKKYCCISWETRVPCRTCDMELDTSYTNKIALSDFHAKLSLSKTARTLNL